MKLSYQTIGEDLVAEIPEFAYIYEEHLSDHNEVLPHVLFGDFTRFVINVYRKSSRSPDYQNILTRCLHFIELMFESGDPKLDELAHVSFLENLSQAGSDYNSIKKHLRKLSLDHLRMIDGNGNYEKNN